jgi:hypothetical protein
MGFWMLKAVARNEALGSPDPRITDLGKIIVRDTVDDYLCMPPDRIVVPRAAPERGDFDVLAFFMRDARFAKLLTSYRLFQATSVNVFEQISPMTAVGTNCVRRVSN